MGRVNVHASRQTRLAGLLAIAAVVLLPACGSKSTTTTTAPSTVSSSTPGPLTGTWLLTAQGGKGQTMTWSLVLTETGVAVSGTSSLNAASVVVAGSVSGSVSGSTLTFTISGTVPTGLQGSTACAAGSPYTLTGTAQTDLARTITLNTGTLQDGCGLAQTLQASATSPSFVKQ